MNYGVRLKELREEKELRIYDISHILNVDKDLYGKYEREYVIIPLKHLNTICNYFDVSFDYVFGFTDHKQYDDYSKEINLSLVGKNIKEFRKERKLTQKKLAEKLNVANSIICEYEKGHYLISTHALYSICKKYDISADYLLGKIKKPLKD